MLAGTLRRGSGITGFGGGWGAPVVIGPFWESCALSCVPSRPFGAGFGTGTFCAEDGVAMATMDAAVSSASAVRAREIAGCFVIRYFESLFNATSHFAALHFIVVGSKEIWFF